MYVAKFWARSSAPNPLDQAAHPLVQYGHSQDSRSEAQTMAEQRLGEIIAQLREGGKTDLQQSLLSYQEVDPLREEFIDEKFLDHAHLAWTRNSYGSLVLNTDRIMFVDIDFDEPSWLQSVRRWPSYFARRFIDKWKGREPLREAQQLWKNHHQLAQVEPRSAEELGAVQRLLLYYQQHPDLGGRLYRTKVGLRLLVTSHFFEPDSDLAQNLMMELGSDALYVKLCRIQKSFRARLTAKPWRCGMKRHHFRYPYTPETAQEFAQWLAAYQDKQSAYQSCAFLCRIGAAEVVDDIRVCVELHDQACRALDHKPLA